MDTINKYLVFDKSHVADSHINQIKMEFISRINAISNAIAAFGIPVTKPMVLIALKTPTSILDARHKAFAAMDAEHRKSIGDEMFEKMSSDIETPMLNKLIAACNEITGGDFTFFNGMSISNPAVLDWFDIDENGNAFIPEKVIWTIEESQRKYITTPIGKELRDLQCEIADKLEKMYDMMRTIDNRKKQCLDFDAKGAMFHFPGSLFEYKDVNDFMQIIPRTINFDPVNRDDVY